jgi:hypothetical protein
VSKRKTSSDLITIEDAASILGCGIDKVREYANSGDLQRLRTPNGELRFSQRDVKQRAYIIRCVAAAPPISDAGIDRIAVLLRPRHLRASGPYEPSESELRRRKEADERAAALKELKRKALALTACHGCGLQPEEHSYQSAYGMGYHEWEPIRG